MINNSLAALIVYFVGFTFCIAAAIRWRNRRRVWRDPRETYIDRIDFSIYRWPEWLQPWGHALVKIMRTVRLMARVWKTEAEFDEMASRFSCVLAHGTGGRMSKNNYDWDTMRVQMDDFVEQERFDHAADLVSDLPDWDMFTRDEVAEHFGVAAEVKEAVKRKRQINELVRRDSVKRAKEIRARVAEVNRKAKRAATVAKAAGIAS